MNYDTDAFLEYARTQVEAAETVLAKHHLAGLGLCACGRIHPCDENRRWRRTRDHFIRYIEPMNEWPQRPMRWSEVLVDTRRWR